MKKTNLLPRDRDQKRGLFAGESVLLLDPDDFAAKAFDKSARITRTTNALIGDVEGHWDRIMSLHSLNRIAKNDAYAHLAKLRTLIKPAGTLHIAVPSLEWGCRHVLADKPNPSVLVHFFGLQDKPENFFLSGWTMRLLRKFLAEAGWKVQEARRESYKILIGNAEFDADQHYVEAVPGLKETEPEEALE